MKSESTPTQPAVLVTIIGERVLRESIVKLLKHHGVTGYTTNDVQGEGGHGRRMGDIPGYNTNIEIKTVVSSDVSDNLFQDLAEYRNDHALIAYRHTVDTMTN